MTNEKGKLGPKEDEHQRKKEVRKSREEQRRTTDKRTK
jgi:hypothetical protein